MRERFVRGNRLGRLDESWGYYAEDMASRVVLNPFRDNAQFPIIYQLVPITLEQLEAKVKKGKAKKGKVTEMKRGKK